MPIHDWTRVIPGIFHDFHHEWISTIKETLHSGVLPPDYYALAEQIAGGLGPDAPTLERNRPSPSPSRIAIRHGSDDPVVALIEIVSPGNKASRQPTRANASTAPIGHRARSKLPLTPG
jgi:hypothetical protein